MTTYTPGSLLFVHGDDLSSRLVAAATHSHWCHVALVVSTAGDLVEAVGKGVRRAHVDDYAPQNRQIVVPSLTPTDQQRAVDYAESRVGERYGRLEIVGVALSAVTGYRLMLGIAGEHICSGLVAESLAHAGLDFGTEEDFLTPADLARWFHVTPE